MECVANYEIKAECSLIEDDLILKFQHPKGLYRVRLQNIPRTTFSTPFLLSLHLYFQAENMGEAKEVADDLLADFLNMLAFTTGGSFRRHGIKQIVDAKVGNGMRDVLFWTETLEYGDPQPMLNKETTQTIEKLLSFEMPPAIQRAMRWYRLGINASVPDDQFMYFWFAIEIIAEFQKSPDKVPSKCPKCQSPLYCEDCKAHPTHKPYPKQAIKTLLQSADDKFDDTMFEQLDTARNSLMHGKTLKEIERKLPDPHEKIVDVLGHLLLKTLIHQFPRNYFDGSLALGIPSTYVHRKMNALAHMQTIVPTMPDGDFDMRFQGMTATWLPDGPPQSSEPFVVHLTKNQFETLKNSSYKKGEHQEVLHRCSQHFQEHGDEVYVQMLATDVAILRKIANQGEPGEWQDLFRVIFEADKKESGT